MDVMISLVSMAVSYLLPFLIEWLRYRSAMRRRGGG